MGSATQSWSRETTVNQRRSGKRDVVHNSPTTGEGCVSCYLALSLSVLQMACRIPRFNARTRQQAGQRHRVDHCTASHIPKEYLSSQPSLGSQKKNAPHNAKTPRNPAPQHPQHSTPNHPQAASHHRYTVSASPSSPSCHCRGEYH